MRAIFGLSLALCLVSLTVSAMVARGAMAADGQLCMVTGGDRVVLAADGLPLIDAQGEPVMLDAPLCPDCVMGSVALAPDATTALRPDGVWGILHPVAVTDVRAPIWRMGGHGRGPPVRV